MQGATFREFEVKDKGDVVKLMEKQMKEDRERMENVSTEDREILEERIEIEREELDDIDPIAEKWERLNESGNGVALAADVDGDYVAFTQIVPYEEVEERNIGVISMGVLDDYIKEGKRMINKALEIARGRGFDAVTVGQPRTERIEKIYIDVGFWENEADNLEINLHEDL